MVKSLHVIDKMQETYNKKDVPDSQNLRTYIY